MIPIIAIVDAEIAENPSKLRRLPNLACLKLSSHYKQQGNEVSLKTDYNNLHDFQKVLISKIFTKTTVPHQILSLPNVTYGGTGFFYDKAPPLIDEIEHLMPDYTLYNHYVSAQLGKGTKPISLKGFTDYSLGFLTRGCFRKCSFCVNKKYNHCITHSPLSEFYDPTRKKIMLLDDNVLANKNWQSLIEALIDTNKPFCFKQGVDIRLITPKFAGLINKSKYDGELFFAFDNIKDAEVIEIKLSMFREHSKKGVKMYLFCGYDETGKYDHDFWLKDIENIFKRLAIMGKYGVSPYVMRYEKYLDSPYAGLYKTIATYCNFGGLFKVSSFSDFCENQRKQSKNQDKPCSRWRYYADFIQLYPYFETRFFNTHFWVSATDSSIKTNKKNGGTVCTT